MRNWAYLETAPNQVFAEMWREMLIEAGIPAMLQPEDAISFIGVSAQPVRVMVAADKLKAAQKLLAEWENFEPDDFEGEDVEGEPGKSIEPRGR